VRPETDPSAAGQGRVHGDVKVEFVTGMCTHYRVRPFELLAQAYDTEYLFFSDGREWYWPPERGVSRGEFRGEYLPGFRVGRTRVTPSLAWRLVSGEFDVVIKCINGRFALPITYVAARLRQKPFVLWTGIWCRLTTPSHRAAWPIVHFILRHADACVVYGEHTKRYLMAEGVDESAIFVAANAVDNDAYRRDLLDDAAVEAAADRSGFVGDSGRVLFVGRLEPNKGLTYLLRAFAQVSNAGARLAFVGDGSERQALLNLARFLGIEERITFVGSVPPESIPSHMAAADMLVLPSVKTEHGKEPWGLVVNEAFNLGVPVIVTDVVGAAAGSLVRDGHNGLVVPERDVEGLRRALERLLSDESFRKRTGDCGRLDVSRFTPIAMVHGFSQAIEFALSRTTQPHPTDRRARAERWVTLLRSGQRAERVSNLLEVRASKLLPTRGTPEAALAWSEALPALAEMFGSDVEIRLAEGGESLEVLADVQARLAAVRSSLTDGPPHSFDADPTLAWIAHALARSLLPRVVLETGVGWGVTSAVILAALEANAAGRLVSIDLPSLDDPRGRFTGSAVDRTDRWTLRSGSSRRLLRPTLQQLGGLDMFVCDSANVPSLQRFEIRSVLPWLRGGGSIVVNNTSERLVSWIATLPTVQAVSVMQLRKPGCATTVLRKMPCT
jgi:glycosyltransferase involved in cell wall biosynthesis